MPRRPIKSKSAMTVAPATAPSLRRLKDTLYGYIYLSKLEHALIQDELLLRLHYVRQNSTAYLTYPTAHGTRFAHSVGAMHLGGTLLARALQNIEAGANEEICRRIERVLSDVYKRNLTELYRDLRKPEKMAERQRLESDGLYRMHGLVPLTTKEAFADLLLFQALRFACLVHDLGHPPFSHVSEEAFKVALPKTYRGHESAGLALLKNAITRQNPETFAYLCLDLATDIVNKNEELAFISELVSGDVDADRLDYVRRDTDGVDLATARYEVSRFVDSATILREDKPDGKVQLRFLFSTQALSALEAFFVARFNLYRWMIWHHNVRRMDYCLKHSLYNLMMHTDAFPEKVRQGTAELKQILEKELTDEYWGFDDGYLLTLLRDALTRLEHATDPAEEDAAADGAADKETKKRVAEDTTLLLKVFLRRDTHLLRPLWKRVDQYRQMASAVIGPEKANEGDPVLEFNRQLAGVFRKVVGHKTGFAAEMEFTRQLCVALQEKKGTRWHATYISKFSALPSKTYLVVRERSRKPVRLRDLSPVITSLEPAWMGLPHLLLFAENPPQSFNTEQQIRRVAKSIGNFLRKEHRRKAR